MCPHQKVVLVFGSIRCPKQTFFWIILQSKNQTFIHLFMKADDQGPWVYFPRDKPNNGFSLKNERQQKWAIWRFKNAKNVLGQWQNSTQRIILRSKLRFVLLFEVHNLILAKSIKSLIRKKRASYKQRILLAPQ